MCFLRTFAEKNFVCGNTLMFIEMKKLFCFCMFLAGIFSAKAVTVTHVPYAVRDTGEIFLTIYTPDAADRRDYTFVYMFGGGFFEGNRLDSVSTDYCATMSGNGYTVVAVDYRLGMQGVKARGMKFVRAMQHAIDLAVEDCADAVAFLVKNADSYGIDAHKIILTGSSAGAITSLQTDYCHANGSELTKSLPADFRFAGVIPYAGAIFSTEGYVDYRFHAPAPTMFFHGTSDKVVNYDKIKIANLGLFGASSLARRFKKFGYPYYIRRYENLGHEVCSFGSRTVAEVEYFIQKFIDEGRQLTVDETYFDPAFVPDPDTSRSLGDLY